MSQVERLKDEIAILQYQAGDHEALSRLIARRQRPLYAYISMVLGDADAAWDVSQEVWAAVVKALRRPRKIRCFPSWLYRTAHNRCVSHLRKKGRYEPTAEVETAAGGQTCEGGAEAFIVAEDARAVREAIMDLSLSHRETVTLFYLEELSLKEISEILGIPVGTVQSRLYHARLKLKAILSRKGYRNE